MSANIRTTFLKNFDVLGHFTYFCFNCWIGHSYMQLLQVSNLINGLVTAKYAMFEMYTNEINYHYQCHYQYKMQCIITNLSTADSITQYVHVNISCN